MPVAPLCYKDKRLFKESQRGFEIPLPTLCKRQSCFIARLPFEVTQFFCLRETVVKCFSGCLPCAEVEMKFSLCAGEMHECAKQLVALRQFLARFQGLPGLFQVTKQETVIGEIILCQGKEVMHVRTLRRASCFQIEFQRVSQFSTLRGDIAKFKQGGAQVAHIVGETMRGDRFL